MILLPHGGYPLLVSTFATMAWMTSISQDGCDFVRITGTAVKVLTNSDAYPFAELGFNSYRVPTFYPDYNEWQVRYSDVCLSYDEMIGTKNEGTKLSDDPFMRIGSISHVIGIMFGGAGCLFLWLTATYVAVTKLNWRLLGFQLMIAAFFHFTSFLWFFNPLCSVQGSVCHWFYGSNANIFTFGSYMISSICIFVKYPEPIVVKLVRQKVEADFQKYERSEMTQPPSEFDEFSGVHSTSGFSSHQLNSNQRSKRIMNMVV